MRGGVMDIQKIKELALANGFSLKEQASGNMDLHSYVYEFANAIEQAAKAQAVPEGFVLLPIKDAKFFSHDGDNYEVHDTLVEAKYEAECAIEHYRERLADQLSDPRSDGNFQDVGYGVVLAKSGYSIDHVVTQADIDKGDYSYEVGTEILSLFLIEAQEPASD
ncbi:MAG: hypothetical protein L0G39_18880 [Chryseobacterium sp.]|nr:hypothetical protein [Chryseobacterium sp.]